MAFYRILGISDEEFATNESVKAAAERCRELLKNECPETRLASSIEYINNIEHILVSKEGRECYNNIVQSEHTYTSPLRASLILKRITWFNQYSDVALGDSLLYNLKEISESRPHYQFLVHPPYTNTLKCRWCDKNLVKSDIVSVMCKCDSRCGHEECLNKFMSEHSRCPVCRHKLLRRESISKYMFFNKNSKYIVR